MTDTFTQIIFPLTEQMRVYTFEHHRWLITNHLSSPAFFSLDVKIQGRSISIKSIQ